MSNYMHAIDKDVKMVALTWIVVSLVICYGKPNWSILKDDRHHHSFVRILFVAGLITLVPFFWPVISKAVSIVKI